MPIKAKAQPHKSLPTSLTGLVRQMPPMAIRDDVHHENTLEMIDRLMQVETLSKDQSHYLETLVELAEAYESKHHAIDLSGLTGLRMLRHIIEQSGMSASDLARLLQVHPSLGSKLLKGERQLTWDHAKILASYFKVAPSLFMEN